MTSRRVVGVGFQSNDARVLHVTSQLSRGGAGRALMSLASHEPRHEVVSLVAPDPATRDLASRLKVTLWTAPEAKEVDKLIKAAEVVQVHFWNTPELYAFLDRPWPGARWLVWAHVNGRTAPHVLIPEVRDFADLVVLTEMPDSALPLVPDGTRSIPAGVDLARLGHGQHTPSEDVTIGLFGSLDATTVHPEVAQVLIDTADVWDHLLIVGSGDGVGPVLRRMVDAGLNRSVTTTGFVEDVGRHLREMDILVHLARPDASSTSDLSVQEAMSLGVVPLVLARTGPAKIVRHGIDGMVAATPAEAASDLRTLATDPDLRRNLAMAASSRTEQFDSVHTRQAFAAAYCELRRSPRRARRLSAGGPLTGAAAFIRSLGATETKFRESQTPVKSHDEAARTVAADLEIAASPPALVSPGGGGILHYRRAYPQDPWLRYWSGLVLAHGGRHALAAGEFMAANRLGLATDRVAPHLDALRRQSDK
jgi:glycosyltransferase involved in cell wall biosynthesis